MTSWRDIPGFDNYQISEDKQIRKILKQGHRGVAISDKFAVNLSVKGNRYHRGIEGLYRLAFAVDKLPTELNFKLEEGERVITMDYDEMNKPLGTEFIKFAREIIETAHKPVFSKGKSLFTPWDYRVSSYDERKTIIDMNTGADLMMEVAMLLINIAERGNTLLPERYARIAGRNKLLEIKRTFQNKMTENIPLKKRLLKDFKEGTISSEEFHRGRIANTNYVNVDVNEDGQDKVTLMAAPIKEEDNMISILKSILTIEEYDILYMADGLKSSLDEIAAKYSVSTRTIQRRMRAAKDKIRATLS